MITSAPPQCCEISMSSLSVRDTFPLSRKELGIATSLLKTQASVVSNREWDT